MIPSMGRRLAGNALVDALMVAAVGRNPLAGPNEVTEYELRAALERFPKDARLPRVGVQPFADDRRHHYPAALMHEALVEILLERVEIFFFGQPGRVKSAKSLRAVKNLSADGLSWREQVAVLKTCDVFVGPEGPLLFLAASFGHSCVALCGPDDWVGRANAMPWVWNLHHALPCSPCNYQPADGQSAFPPHGPCAKSGRCEALALVRPRRIALKVKQLLAEQAKADRDTAAKSAKN